MITAFIHSVIKIVGMNCFLSQFEIHLMSLNVPFANISKYFCYNLLSGSQAIDGLQWL